MALLHIAEPGAAAPAVPTQRKIGLGIDLGTTNSLIAHFDGAELTVFTDSQGRSALPSVVHYSSSGHTVGFDALEHEAADQADNVASAKRYLGRSREELEEVSHVVHFADSKRLAFATSGGA